MTLTAERNDAALKTQGITKISDPKRASKRCRHPVARFFFHTNHPAERNVQDDEGMEFESVHQAKCEAVKYAGQLLADVAEHFWDNGDFDLTVTDDHGLILFTMRVVGIEAPAIRIMGRHTPS